MSHKDAPPETESQKACREWWEKAQPTVKRAWGRAADGSFLAEQTRLLHKAWEAASQQASAEIEALRTEAEQHFQQAMSNGAKARAAQAQANNLRTEVEALRAEVERSERYAEQSECERLWAEERAELLAEALRLAEEHINDITPEWYSAGQRVLAAIRAALRDHDQENDDA